MGQRVCGEEMSVGSLPPVGDCIGLHEVAMKRFSLLCVRRKQRPRQMKMGAKIRLR